MRDTTTKPVLTDSDLLRWGRVACQRPASRDELTAWLAGPVVTFFPCRHVLVANWEHFAGEVRVTQWVQAGDPVAGPGDSPAVFELEAQPVLAHWMRHRTPVYIEPDAAAGACGGTAIHGVADARARSVTHLRFSGVPGPFTSWHVAALALMAPLLHERSQCLLRPGEDIPPGAMARLTPRQREIVRGVARGHDDKSIARAMGISDKTVRNQLCEVYALLGLSRRTQLVALML